MTTSTTAPARAASTMTSNASADLARKSAAIAPARRNYKGTHTPLSELPFVYRPKRGQKGASNWRVPPTDDYESACDVGRQYAAHFARFLQDNPISVGSNVLGAIVNAIDFDDEGDVKGYWVGFFSYLERLICAAAESCDVFADADAVSAYYAEALARRESGAT